MLKIAKFTGIFIILVTSILLAENNVSAKVYNEPVHIQSSLGTDLSSYFYQGSHFGLTNGDGGVLFANGTVINASLDQHGNSSIPITFGDDARIDGEIWRGPSKGISDDQPLKISDTIIPTMTNINDIGNSNNRWKDIYYSGAAYGKNVVLTGELWGGTSRGIGGGDRPLYISDSVYPTETNVNSLGSSTHRWTDIFYTGNLTGATAIFSGDVRAQGDINQDINDNGAIKAMAYVVNTPSVSVSRSWTYDDSSINVSDSGTTFILTFGFNVSNRFWNVTATTEGFSGSAKVGSNNNQLEVRIQYNSTGTYHLTPFMITIY